MQRGLLPLHGSAIAINGNAYVIIGDSGAGKSTLAKMFLNRGYQLLTDDVIAVDFSENNRPYIIPAYPQQKLWKESLNEFGMNSDQFRPIYGREMKYCIPATNQFFTGSLPLNGVFELVKSDIELIESVHIKGLNRLKTISYHTYRNFLIPGLGLMESHFKMSTRIANDIKMIQLRRPKTHFTANQLANLILEEIKKENYS